MPTVQNETEELVRAAEVMLRLFEVPEAAMSSRHWKRQGQEKCRGVSHTQAD